MQFSFITDPVLHKAATDFFFKQLHIHNSQHERKCTKDVILRRVRETIVAMEK